MARYKKGQSGNPKGRPKGIQNKVTNSMKEAFMEAFDDIGGIKELAKWGKAQKNRTVFYQIISKLLPRQIDSEVKGDIKIILKQFNNDK